MAVKRKIMNKEARYYQRLSAGSLPTCVFDNAKPFIASLGLSWYWINIPDRYQGEYKSEDNTPFNTGSCSQIKLLYTSTHNSYKRLHITVIYFCTSAQSPFSGRCTSCIH